MRRLLILSILPIVAFASSGGGSGETDILPRAVNFLIFAAIFYYLLADHAKKFFGGRIQDISHKLDSIQEKLKESKNRKEEAILKVEDAKNSAKTIVATAKKEAQLLSEKIAKDTKNEIENILKGYDERMEIEQRKVSRAVVQEIIEEIFAKDSVSINQSELVDILKKKVA